MNGRNVCRLSSTEELAPVCAASPVRLRERNPQKQYFTSSAAHSSVRIEPAMHQPLTLCAWHRHNSKALLAALIVVAAKAHAAA